MSKLVPWFDLIFKYEVIESKEFESEGITLQIVKEDEMYFLFMYADEGRKVAYMYSKEKGRFTGDEETVRKLFNSVKVKDCKREIERQHNESMKETMEIMKSLDKSKH